MVSEGLKCHLRSAVGSLHDMVLLRQVHSAGAPSTTKLWQVEAQPDHTNQQQGQSAQV